MDVIFITTTTMITSNFPRSFLRRFAYHRVFSTTTPAATVSPSVPSSSSPVSSSWKSTLKHGNKEIIERPSWSEEWKRLGLGATLVDDPSVFMSHLFFVQVGTGIDQHGDADATKAAIRAVRNAIEFNSIPGVIEHIPGGRKEMLLGVKLGVPQMMPTTVSTTTTTTTTSSSSSSNHEPVLHPVDLLQVAKVFPYGRLLPIEVVTGGLSFPTGRIVEELGDTNDLGICVTACVSVGYQTDSSSSTSSSSSSSSSSPDSHTTYSTKEGY